MKTILFSHRVTRIFFLYLFLAAGLVLKARDSGDRTTILIDNDWLFHLGHAADPAKDFNYSVANIFSKSGKAENTAIDPKFDDSGWRTVQLPHDWAVELPFVNSMDLDVMAHGYKPVGGLFPETSIGWYRKHFSVSPADSGKRFIVRFDGVFRDANAWLNGFFLGNNKSGYMGVSYDVTDYVDFHHDNVLVVRVDATQYEGWFYEGAGIYRHVWLTTCDNLHIAENGIYIVTSVKDSSASVSVETTLENQGLLPAICTEQLVITDRKGEIIDATMEKTFSVAAGSVVSGWQQLAINDPRLWSPGDPYLYRAVVIVRQDGQVVDRQVIPFGVRTIRFDPSEGFFLNGKNIKLTGVCCHQDHSGVGSALPDYLQYYRVGLLKEMGVNAYRCSHNAPTPELLDACDSLGMLVVDEQRLLNSSPEYIGQFEQLILRDRNHPSVILWSIGNEEGYIQTTGRGKRIAQTFIARQKQLDPARTCTYAADLPNVFTGINEVIPVRGFNYRQFAVMDYHESHPGQPIVGTEMGSTVTTRGIYEKDTIRCYLPDQDITAPWWASRAEEWWKLCAEQPWFAGGFVWTGFDYRGEPTPFHWPNISSHFGIMDVCGFPKNIYYYYQSWWTDKDVLHISPHWNRKGKDGEPIKVWVNTNADSAELLLNGKSLGMKTMFRNSHLEWSVPYEPGKLEAQAYKQGRKITASLETTDPPAKVVIKPSKLTLLADGRDALVLNVTVVDHQNREVPDAGNLIRLKVTGPGKIIGCGNGDPSCHEPDKCPDNKWQRSLFSGKCQFILQAKNEAGVIKAEAFSEGLSTDIAEIRVTGDRR